MVLSEVVLAPEFEGKTALRIGVDGGRKMGGVRRHCVRAPTPMEWGEQ